MYSIHMNCRYSHDLDSSDLDNTLQSLVDRKLIWARIVNDRTELSYTLTADGGAFWERERNPDWNSYVDARQNFSGTNQSALAIQEVVARQYLGGLFASGSIVAKGRIRTKTIRRCKLLPWRVFDSVAVARVPIQRQDDLTLPRYWDAYEIRRHWWSDVHELDALGRVVR